MTVVQRGRSQLHLPVGACLDLLPDGVPAFLLSASATST